MKHRPLKNVIREWRLEDGRIIGAVICDQPEAGCKAGDIVCTSPVVSIKTLSGLLVATTGNSHYVLVQGDA